MIDRSVFSSYYVYSVFMKSSQRCLTLLLFILRGFGIQSTNESNIKIYMHKTESMNRIARKRHSSSRSHSLLSMRCCYCLFFFHFSFPSFLSLSLKFLVCLLLASFHFNSFHFRYRHFSDSVMFV